MITPLLLSALGCTLSQQDFCSNDLPRLRADLGGQQIWVVDQKNEFQRPGRELASIEAAASSGVLGLFKKSAHEVKEEEKASVRRQAQGWAIDRLSLVQRAQDALEQNDRHDLLPLLRKLNNELVSYYGYAEELNWERMQRRLREMGTLSEEVARRVCAGT